MLNGYLLEKRPFVGIRGIHTKWMGWDGKGYIPEVSYILHN